MKVKIPLTAADPKKLMFTGKNTIEWKNGIADKPIVLVEEQLA